MAETTQWEYRVESMGSIWRSPKDEDIEALLDEWGDEGWEVVSVFAQYGSNKVRIVAKRPLTVATRRQRNWPS